MFTNGLIGSWRLLGTPTEQQWPGVSTLRDWHVYPKWEPQDLTLAVPSLSPQGVDLLTVIHCLMTHMNIVAKQL